MIVSAGAGSGKTTVLTERVVSLVCDAEEPCSLDQMIIVTFTKASAAEMRSRIAAKLSEKYAKEPNNRFLRSQIAFLPSARIQTIDSLCYDIVRENFDLCGVAPDFKIIDTADEKELKSAAVKQTLDEAYATGDPDFYALIESVCDMRSDKGIEEMILSAHSRWCRIPDRNGWMTRQKDRVPGIDPLDEDWGKKIFEYSLKRLADSAEKVRRELAFLTGYPDTFKRFEPVLSYCLDFYAKALSSKSEGWDAFRDAVRVFKCPSLDDKKKTENENVIRGATAVRDDFKGLIIKLKNVFFEKPADAVYGEELSCMRYRKCFCSLLTRFDDIYSAAKAEKGVLDFNDLEYLTLKLLTAPDGNASQTAKDISSGLRELMVDEYQDTDYMQDAIFSLIEPRHGGVFMVGDVKQSIYRFRNAEPAIFVKKYLTYPTYDPQDAEQWECSLSLNENYRSSSSVLDCANLVFSQTMSETFGGVNYASDGALVKGPQAFYKTYPAELILMDNSGGDDESSDKKTAQAEYAAERIAQMLKEPLMITDDPFSAPWQARAAEPGDFAILLSSFRENVDYFRQALIDRNVPVHVAGSGFFDMKEIRIMISLLRVVDNRRQDVALVSLLRSPVFLYTADELAALRLEGDDSLYECLESAAQKAVKRATEVKNTLDRWIFEASYMSITAFLRKVYNTTFLSAAVSAEKGSRSRGENLEILYELASDYEKRSFEGIPGFLKHLEKMMDSGVDPGTGSEADGVRIMSIHNSKGLEFPVVILPQLEKPFNTDDQKAPAFIDKDMGFAFRMSEGKRWIKYKSQSYTARAAMTSFENKQEELRKLYVAMTRAKEKLILIGEVSNVEKRLNSACDRLSDGMLSPYVAASYSNALDWVLSAALCCGSCADLRSRTSMPPPAIYKAENLTASIVYPDKKEETLKYDAGEKGSAMNDKYLSYASMDYEYAAVSALPSKLTPTGVKKAEESAGETDGKKVYPFHRIVRLKTGAEDAAGIGRSIHKCLQFADINACLTDPRSELERMTAQGLINAGDAAAADPEMLRAFAESEPGKRVAKADRVFREKDFCVLFTPDEVLKNGVTDENILMTGTIDLLIFEGGRATVIDFKSDRIVPGDEKAAAEKHRVQLDIYMRSVVKMTGMEPGDMIVYFTRTSGWATL